MISTHKNGYFSGDYSSIDKVPKDRTVVEINYTGSFLKPFFNGTEWIEGATPVEQDAYAEEKKNELVKAFMQKKKIDGEVFANDIRFRITKDLIGKPIAEVNEIDSQCKVTVMPLLELIEGVGADWWTAMNESFVITAPTNAIALQYFDEVKNHIINYVQTNYPTEEL